MEFGQVTVLVTTFFALSRNGGHLVAIAFILSLITIVVPGIFYPFAVCWFGLSKIISQITSRVLMCIVFLVIVIPVGLLRKLLGIDSLKIRQFKKGQESVMVERNHLYNKADLLNTF
jgi:hypothetical protein